DATEVAVTRRGTDATLWIDGRSYEADLHRVGRAYELSLGDRVEKVWLAVDQDTVYVHAFGRAFALEVFDPVERSLQASVGEDTVTAPMPGTVVSIAVAEGEEVHTGQVLVTIESMKMQSEMTASRDGRVERVHREVGETFDRGDALISLEPEDETAKEEA
ncbi:MAG: biotin/lipoyl-binding protein, partial [Actinobacteria bacterium]|nr:biotin/lipoyl-binding protein [Actinomycetota bacterium]